MNQQQARRILADLRNAPPFQREAIDWMLGEIERLTAECSVQNNLAKKYRRALQEISEHYVPNWEPGITHRTCQEIAEVAWTALGAPVSTQQKFRVDHSKGFWWVTEIATNHNYAQTDSEQRAREICAQLEAGEEIDL